MVTRSPGLRRKDVRQTASVWSTALLTLIAWNLGLAAPLRAAQPESALKQRLLIHSDGNRLPVGLLAQLAAASKVPIYSISPTYLGTGTVGGMVFDATADARAAAGLVVQRLRGAKPETLQSIVSPPVHLFDWRALRRYGLAE